MPYNCGSSSSLWLSWVQGDYYYSWLILCHYGHTYDIVTLQLWIKFLSVLIDEKTVVSLTSCSIPGCHGDYLIDHTYCVPSCICGTLTFQFGWHIPGCASRSGDKLDCGLGTAYGQKTSKNAEKHIKSAYGAVKLTKDVTLLCLWS